MRTVSKIFSYYHTHGFIPTCKRILKKLLRLNTATPQTEDDPFFCPTGELRARLPNFNQQPIIDLISPLPSPPESFQTQRIAVFLHCFYLEGLDKIALYLKNIPTPFHLIVTTDTEGKRAIIKPQLEQHGFTNIHILVLPNRGRDIAPHLAALELFKDSFDIGLLIHIKRSKYQDGLAWEKYLLENIVGSPQVVTSLLTLFNQHPKLGIAAPQHWPILLRNEMINWAGNFDHAKKLLQKLGFILSATTLLDFASGSMLWFRNQALQPLLDLKLTVNDFETEDGQLDGTLAHAIERICFYICELSGHYWIKVKGDCQQVDGQIIPLQIILEKPSLLENLFTPLTSTGLPLPAANMPPMTGIVDDLLAETIQ